MAASTREAALVALAAVIDGATAAEVLRNQDVPERLPAGGLVVIEDGETRDVETTLSPLMFHHEHAARVSVVTDGADDDARDEALDTLLQAVVAAILADRTLGGAVEWAQPMETSTQPIETGRRGKAVSFDVVLMFSTSGSPTV